MVIDDDLSSFKGISRIGLASGFVTVHFPEAAAFVAWCSQQAADKLVAGGCYCIVVDTKFADVFKGPAIPLEMLRWPRIYISRSGKVASAVSTLKIGHNEFLAKPFSISQMRDSLERIFAAMEGAASESTAYKSGFAELTKREREVFGLVVSGLANKAISDQLGIALKTVKVHRANLMRKLGVKSLVELVRAHDLLHAEPQTETPRQAAS